MDTGAQAVAGSELHFLCKRYLKYVMLLYAPCRYISCKSIREISPRVGKRGDNEDFSNSPVAAKLRSKEVPDPARQKSRIMETALFTMENPELIEKKFSILQEISKAIVVTDNINAVADLTLDLAISYTNAEKGSLMLANENDELYILAARGFDAEFNGHRERIGHGIAGIVAKNRCPVLVEDIDKDSRFSSKKRNHYKNKSFISCPIICKNRLLGVFNINDKKNGGHFVIDDFALLNIIANQAAITIENAFLLTQLRSKAAELEEINKKLIESDEAKNEFIIRISHELRTPLNSIKGSIYYLGQNNNIGRHKQKEFFEIIAHGVNELRNSVEHLLNFLRRENDTQAIKISHTPSDPG